MTHAEHLMRAFYWHQKCSRGSLGYYFSKWRHSFWSIVTGASIPIRTRIGWHLNMPHPNGIVIHPAAVIGHNVTIFQQVTIGSRTRRVGVPRIGDCVEIGAGAKLLGPIKIGFRACIGANAVVLCDVPPYATAIGVPARVILKEKSK